MRARHGASVATEQTVHHKFADIEAALLLGSTSDPGRPGPADLDASIESGEGRRGASPSFREW